MKKAILLILWLFLSLAAFAQKGEQTVGLVMGATALKVKQIGIRDKNDVKVFPIGGFYYDRAFSTRLGLSIGLQVRTFEENKDYRFVDSSPFSGENNLKYTYLDLPINLTVNLNWRETQAWQPYLVFGYNYSWLIRTRMTNLYSKQVNQYYTGINSSLNLHYLNAGFEVRHNLSGKYALAINPGYCADLNLFVVYKEQHQSYVYLKLKFGKRF